MKKNVSGASSARKTKTPPTKTASSVNQIRYILGAIAVLLIVAVLVVINLPDSGGNESALFPDEIDVHQAYQLYQQGVFLLDVRTQSEWDEIHVPNATLIPLDQLESRLEELPSDQQIIVMCRSGNRSQTGRDILRRAGFKNVSSMAGGIREWSAAGYPTEP